MGEGFLSNFFRSPTVRLLSLMAMTLVLMVPLLLIDFTISERRGRRDSAIQDVSAKWGLSQQVAGPALIVPYVNRWIEPAVQGRPAVERSETRFATFLPTKLNIKAAVQTEARSRGIFSVPVYRLTSTLEGDFGRLPWSDLGVDPANARLDHAALVLGISDVRAIGEQPTLTWNGATAAFLPGAEHLAGAGPGIHAPIALTAADRYHFSFTVTLNGSVGLSFTPFAEMTTVTMTSPWQHPSFTGNWLPTERTVSDAGFQATWAIPFLGRNFPQQWTSAESPDKAVVASVFGVDLIDPVDHYRMAERSVKYGGLIILLTFATMWLIEVLAKVRVHPIQYLMLGAALCLFFLLELTVSEHLGFPTAYAIAASAIIALVSAYGVAILGRARRSAVVATGVTSLYGYLFVLLTNEDYALLIGSIGTFVILAGIMFLTRRVDWYRLAEGGVRS